MSALSPILRSIGAGRVAFWCPGCRTAHQVAVGGGSGPRWSYNGDANAPTFTPSVLVQSGHFIPDREAKDCWCNYERRTGEPPPFSCGRCHSFVTAGHIRFLSDCTHELAGQTVPLPPWPGGAEGDLP